MTVKRLAISLDPELARAVRRAAGRQPTSSWLADAARRKLRAEGLLRAVEEWELGHGALTAAELRAAERKQRRRPKAGARSPGRAVGPKARARSLGRRSA